jgi:hypothetical protein
MGWASGSRLAGDLIALAKETISSKVEREEFYEGMIEHFEDSDCDTLDECVGIDPVFDDVWETLYPSDEIDMEDNEDD